MTSQSMFWGWDWGLYGNQKSWSYSFVLSLILIISADEPETQKSDYAVHNTVQNATINIRPVTVNK